ncbi:MAG: molybdopterin-dependent oxidoreductase [Rhodospirillaceae bacterium]|nr:molybdopterin-dependent oxidoreductase [Rhodospirillaceae bacterium]
MLTRRHMLSGAGTLGAGLAAAAMGLPRLAFGQSKLALDNGLPAGVRETVGLGTLPGKVPLIKLTHRPPNYETPVSYFNSLFTPNNAFFVRYHLANIPEVDAASWRLKVGGDAAGSAFELTLDQLKKDFKPVEIAAVCQCSGNRRGLSNPHVPGVEWGYGAMGNARWKGARLKDILDKAGIKKEALEIVIDGADGPILDKTPDFVKSIPAWKAMDENTIVAYEMNGQPLPHFNGFPARLILPGWTGTYWMKHLTSVMAVSKPFSGFWMTPAYRIPLGKFPIVDRFVSQETAVNTPITEIVVNSLITNLADGHKSRLRQPVEVKGIAWDGGYGISLVEISTDGGVSWTPAKLGQDAGRFSFRQWSHAFTPTKPGKYAVMVKASNRIGQSQAPALIFNPAGYHHNVIQKITINVA